MATEDWPDRGDFPLKALIRILPPKERALVVARTIHEAAQKMTNKEVGQIVLKAAKAAINQLSTSSVHGVEDALALGGGGGDDDQCGNYMTWLLDWFRHHGGRVPSGPDDSGGWITLTTVGMVGLLSTQVTGPVRENLASAALSALKVATTQMG
jgi:hypothetical protein